MPRLWRACRGACAAAALHLRVFLFLLILPFVLRGRSVQATIVLLTPSRPAGRRPWADVRRVAGATDRLYLRRFVRAYGPCLRRSLTLYYFVTRLGYPVSVALGATRRPGGFLAHAWLTLDGQAIFEPASVGEFVLMSEWGVGSTLPR